MKQAILIIIGTFLLITSVTGQEYFEKLYCSDRLSYSNKHILTVDSCIYITGYSRSSSSQYSDVLFLKIDSLDQEELINEYGGTGFDEGFDLLKDNQYIYVLGKKVVGDTTNNGEIIVDLTDYYLIKTDLGGNVIWEKTYNINSFDIGSSLQVNGDTLTIAGYSNYYDATQINLIKIDTSGTIHNIISIDSASYVENLSMKRTIDNSFVILTIENDSTLIRKISNVGNIVWNKSNISKCYKIKQVSDGGYILIGSTKCLGNGNLGGWCNNDNIYIAKLNQYGNKEWEKVYGNSSDNEVGYDIKQLSDMGYVISGERMIINNEPHSNSFLFHISMNGDSIWYKEFGISYRSFLSTVDTINNGYIASGGLFKDNNWFVFVVKSDLNGNIDTSFIETIKEKTIINNDFIIYPNPTTGKIIFDYEGYNQLMLLSVFNIKGEPLLRKRISNQGEIDLTYIKDKIVLVEFTTNDLKKIVKRIIIKK